MYIFRIVLQLSNPKKVIWPGYVLSNFFLSTKEKRKLATLVVVRWIFRATLSR